MPRAHRTYEKDFRQEAINLLLSSGSNRTVTVAPKANQIGTATIIITVSDGDLGASDTFIISVTATPQQTWWLANFGTTETATGPGGRRPPRRRSTTTTGPLACSSR